jgi:tRNA nucleotidyltransferase (CCA-adding enzyme)
MSCDSRRRRAWRALAHTDQVARRVLPEDAETLLRQAYEDAHEVGATGDPDHELCRTAELMNRMRWLTGEVPAHTGDDPRFGVPIPRSARSRAGYAAAMDRLDELEGRAPMSRPVRLGAARARYPGADVALLDLPMGKAAREAVRVLTADGMRPMVAGGAVRDGVLGKVPKDIDIEVYGGDRERLVRSLRRLGPVDEVGRAFGVFKVAVPGEDEPLDVSLPRRDSKTGDGHKGIAVQVDADLTPAEAAQRRDLTFNAMTWDPELRVVVDYYDGRADLAAGRIRHVHESFSDDPLRALRAARFSSAYAGRLDPETADLCRGLKTEYATLPEERLQGEWDKLVRGKSPSNGIRALHEMGWDEFTPELATWRVAAEHHGTRAAVIADRHGLAGDQRAQHVYAAITAGMGPDGARRFLASVGEARMRGDLVTRVVNVVREQDLPRSSSPADPVAVRALARRLAPATVRDWARHQETLGETDARPWVARAEALGVADAPEKRIVEGRDILPNVRHGVKPGPWTGQMVVDAAVAQENGEFRDRDGAAAWIAARLRADGLA